MSDVLADCSAHVVERWKVFVGHCGPSPRHVLYVLDGNGYFGAAVDIVRLMQTRALVPPMLVVGVGYPVGQLNETYEQRTYDLTPSVDPAYAALFDGPVRMGGAAELLGFLGRLQSWVGVDGESTFFGHSFGGLFGTWALFQQPSLFDRWILASPSYWWHQGAIFSSEEAYAAAHDDLAANVYMAIGADETNEGRQRESALAPPEQRVLAGRWVLEMVDDMERMVEVLRGRGYPSLRLSSEVFPHEFHVTVPFVVLTHGLRTLFNTP